MVDNARRYYMAVREGKKKGSRVRKKKTGGHEKTAEQMYTYSSKLLEVFNQHIDGAMKSLGYCCGQRVSCVSAIPSELAVIYVCIIFQM